MDSWQTLPPFNTTPPLNLPLWVGSLIVARNYLRKM
jgi:hypothetical protein